MWRLIRLIFVFMFALVAYRELVIHEELLTGLIMRRGRGLMSRGRFWRLVASRRITVMMLAIIM